MSNINKKRMCKKHPILNGLKNPNSVLKNKLRAAANQIGIYLLKRKIITSDNIKLSIKYRLFLDDLKIEIPNGKSISSLILDIYESREYEFLRAQLSRPDITPQQWSKLRIEVFNKYGKSCLKCGSTNRISIDHIKPYSKYPELALSIENLQPLCGSCNSQKSNRHIIDYR